MAQVVERYFREVEAASSSLVTPTLKAQYLLGFLLVRPAGARFFYVLEPEGDRRDDFGTPLDFWA